MMHTHKGLHKKIFIYPRPDKILSDNHRAERKSSTAPRMMFVSRENQLTVVQQYLLHERCGDAHRVHVGRLAVV